METTLMIAVGVLSVVVIVMAVWSYVRIGGLERSLEFRKEDHLELSKEVTDLKWSTYSALRALGLERVSHPAKEEWIRKG